MRTSNKCIKCGSLAIGHVERRFDNTGDRKVGFTSAVLGVIGTTVQGVGVLEAFVCTECGYLETYVKDLAMVPFEQIRGFRWVNEPNAQRGGFR